MSALASIPPPTALIAVPGAPAPSSSKPKRSKKKPTAPVIPALSHLPSAPSINPEVIPGPAIAQAQAQAAEGVSVIPSAIINETSTGSSREKGPVEEVIAKRMRQLSKKLQRFRGYAAQPHNTLNADQRSGVASLTSLEGVYKELEDLSKQVEYVELEQAGKIREIRESAARDAEGVSATKVAEYQTSLSTPLGLFLRLHALLHPARSTDHEHLTFARLELPPILQDEVQATDVLRVGRMQEDLLAGGERGSLVLSALVKGATGEDEENDHVHELLNLLNRASSHPTDASVLEEDPQEEVVEATPDAVESAAGSQPESGAANEEAPLEGGDAAPAPRATTSNDNGGALNFLQEDELVEDSYEVVPRLAAHQTSGLQPPIDAYTPASHQAVEPASTQSRISSPGPAVPTPHFDWAADEDMDEATEAAHIRQAFAMPPSGTATPAAPTDQILEEVETTEQGDAIALVQENGLVETHVPQESEGVSAPIAVDGVTAAPSLLSKSTPVHNQQQNRPRGRGRPNHASGRGRGSQPQSQSHGLPAKPSVDNDGFQVVGRQASDNAQSARGGRGENGKGRGGQSRGRGRPGPRGGGVRSASNAGTAEVRIQSAAPRAPRQNRQPSQAKPKPAPTPASAPAPAAVSQQSDR